jgi:hypothetical protein
LLRQLFQADLSGGEAHARRGIIRVSLGIISGISSRSTKECGNRPMARSASSDRTIEIASAWLLARILNLMAGYAARKRAKLGR